MSVTVLVVALALAGQLVGEDRYGSPPSEPAAISEDSPFGSSLRSNIGPPPPLTSPTKVAPTTTPEDYGYGVPSNSSGPARIPSSPPAAARTPVAARNVDAQPNSKPAAMMRAMLTPPRGSRLTGQPVRLTEIVRGASSRQAQSQRIDAYWDLCSSVADYYLGVREQDELQRLRSTISNVSPVWQEAESELGVRIATSQRAAVAAQYRLASLVGDAGGSSLPLPGDQPHCGDYYARYDQVFAGRPMPEAQQLSELLPMRYEELVGAAAAVTRAEEYLGATASQRNGGGDVTNTLRALELLALRRRAFVQIARDYNHRIARYTELASPGQIDSDRLIGMLIKRDGLPSGGAANTATRPTTPVPPLNRQSQVPLDDPAKTFAEGWESIKSAAAEVPVDELDGDVRQAVAEEEFETETRKPEPRRERSLLVPRSP